MIPYYFKMFEFKGYVSILNANEKIEVERFDANGMRLLFKNLNLTHSF